MSGIYNIGHCVMPWLFSNCEQRSGTCLFLLTQHQNVLNGHSKIDKTKVLMTHGSKHSAILFDLH